jgi:biopolymer transport protein ExbD
MAGATSGYSDEDDGVIGDINVTPLVDITLVLLIVYMITVPAMVKNPAIRVDLPTAATGDATPDTMLNLTMQRSGDGQISVYANGKLVDFEELRIEVPQLLEQNPDLTTIIAADKGIDYGEVVQLVDLMGSLGVHRIALETRRPDSNR